jgi:lipopolysaccharide biosynthesis protein
VFRYGDVVNQMLAGPRRTYFRFPCVTPSWDNSARRKAGAAILEGSTPDEYERWLRAVVKAFRPPEPGHDLVFINAWNEWAEGNHLEPDLRWGRGYLEATQRVLVSDSREIVPAPIAARAAAFTA